jgi:glycyl-tRNA synthetase beta subunit
VFKRAKGQLQKGKAGTLDPALATEPAEQKLLQSLSAMEKVWPNLLKQKSYQEAFTEMAKLNQPLADLFEQVKILDDDPKIASNRLALLHSVFTHFSHLLDFSKIQSK